jgi:anaerobic magnesium-protoporphyrin IX monomethyl ester cyclase
MAGSKAKYGIVEASRGCPNHCSFCSQWKHWGGSWRHKSVKRVADEMEYLYSNYGSKFQWLTDDNFGLNKRTEDLCDELIKRDFSKDITCFMQVRCDDAAKNPRIVEKMSKAGFTWFLLGVESQSKTTLDSFHKGTKPEDAATAVKLLKQNGIFSQATCIVGNRHDTAESIKELKFFIHDINPDIAIFMVLTPFPGTDLYEEAKSKGWIEDYNWANYDMVHATMATDTLTREQVQRELTECYKSFYGSPSRLLKGVFAKNKVKRRVYRYMARQGVIRQLETIV